MIPMAPLVPTLPNTNPYSQIDLTSQPDSQGQSKKISKTKSFDASGIPEPLKEEYTARFKDKIEIDEFAVEKLKQFYEENKQLKGQVYAANTEIKALRHNMFSEHPHAKSQFEVSAKTAKPDVPYQKELQIKASMIA